MIPNTPPTRRRLPAGALHRFRAAAGMLVLVALLAVGLGGPRDALAQREPTQVIKESVEKWLKGRYPVESVRSTPLETLYEVQIGTDLIYVDQRGRFAFVEGQMIDLQDNRNLTQARIEELLRIDFARDLPLDLAIKQVNGNGKRVLAVFEDPNCTYCKKLRRELVNVKDLTIYTFAYPILAPDSEKKSRQALCAKDRVNAWNDLMISGKVPDNDGSCSTSIEKITELGRRLKVTGTPTIFFTNGKRVPGALSMQQLEQALRENGAGG